MRASAPSDCTSRAATKRSMCRRALYCKAFNGLFWMGGSGGAPPPCPPTASVMRSGSIGCAPLLTGGQHVEEEIVHDGANVPLAEGLRRRVGRVQVHHRDPVVLAAQAGVHVAH